VQSFAFVPQYLPVQLLPFESTLPQDAKPAQGASVQTCLTIMEDMYHGATNTPLVCMPNKSPGT
jgi:hypothetical protein